MTWFDRRGIASGRGALAPAALIASLAPLLLIAAARPAAAQEPAVSLDVQVVHISDRPGEIDPRARRLHEQLRRDHRYQSLRVLQTRRMRLETDEVETMQLPDGHPLRVRLNHVDERGALLAVEAEGLKSDLRVRAGHLVVIGGDRYEDGKIVVGLEPHY